MCSQMENIDWEDILLKLHAYSHQLLKHHRWFRGKNCDTSIQGKQEEDYVYEAITSFLENPERFNPSRGTLFNYLKLHVLRRLYSNDWKKPENTLYKDIFGLNMDDEGDDTISYVESLLPVIAASFDENFDYQSIMSEVQRLTQKDPVALRLFHLAKELGYKRREIIESENITEKEFDKGMKRLNRVLEKVALKFDIEVDL